RLREAHPAAVPLKELEKEGFGAALKKMTASERIAYSLRPALGGPKAAHEWWLGQAAEPPASPGRLGRKEQALWELVRGGPAKPMSYYASYLKNPLPQARSLTAKGLTSLDRRETFRDDPGRAIFSENRPAPPPTREQAAALAQIEAALESRRHHGFLLFGVTGSGKTEVYLRAAEKTLAQGREVLWLTPEIALTLGLEGFLKNRLGSEKLAVLHSALTPGQRHDQWLRIRRGLAPVTLGARSAVFAPLENLGLVVVDEEHDPAYKQDDGLRYNGRDLAMRRAREAGAALILGSATPSLESCHSALAGRLTLIKMETRTGEARLPQVEIIDQRQEPARQRKALSVQLQKRLGDVLARGEQALLFINRRGISNLPMCLACGEVMKCPHCSRTLTLHGPDRPGPAAEGAAEASAAIGAAAGSAHDAPAETLVCHCCGYRADPPKNCPKCLSPLFRYFGVGTEKLLKLAEEKFPGVRAGRLDADAARRKGGLKKIISAFASGALNLLVGTQMAAKGHDFPNLTLVGVVEADLGLNLPDFRASERTFQLISQVAGRAGRANTPGTVLIQTMNPSHYALTAAAAHDYETFFKNEINIRAELGYPPFARLALARLTGPDESRMMRLADEAGEIGRLILRETGEAGVELLGPAPSPMARLKDNYRFQIMVRAETVSSRRAFLTLWLPKIRAVLPSWARLTVDIDPYHLL
ncbi:MAG: primosomal protein N', partial [Candidatus Adiutrix sp.]|nr:primosomal protein N' [Candidatus Adiutrix sp.]